MLDPLLVKLYQQDLDFPHLLPADKLARRLVDSPQSNQFNNTRSNPTPSNTVNMVKAGMSTSILNLPRPRADGPYGSRGVRDRGVEDDSIGFSRNLDEHFISLRPNRVLGSLGPWALGHPNPADGLQSDDWSWGQRSSSRC